MVDKADDLDSPLWGARSIAAAANISERTAFHLLQNGLLPGVKIGKIWTTTRRRLLERVSGQDGWVPPKPTAPPSMPPPVPRSRKRKLAAERHRVEAR